MNDKELLRDNIRLHQILGGTWSRHQDTCWEWHYDILWRKRERILKPECCQACYGYFIYRTEGA